MRFVALTGSLLMWAALPPLDLWPLGWIALAPWLFLARQKQLMGAHPYTMLWAAGFVFWMADLHWLRLPHWTTSFGWIALSAYLALYIPLFVGLTRVAVHRLRISIVLAAPVVWTGLEFAKGHLFSGFTMGNLGYSQYHWLQVIQIADAMSVYGLGGLLAMSAACLVRMAPCDGLRWSVWPLAPLVAMMGSTLGYGHMRLAAEPTADAPTTRVALIQGSIDATLKMAPDSWEAIYTQYMQLSFEARAMAEKSGRPIDLFAWPETMFRETLYSFDPDFVVPEGARTKQEIIDNTNRGIALVAWQLGSPTLLGIDRSHYLADGRVRHYNSALFVTADGQQLSSYDKMHPVMFGEYVPLAESFPWLYKLTPLPAGLTSGEKPVAQDVHGFRFAPDICYETTIPHLIRRQVVELRDRGEEPDVLVNLTNDGWFWGSSELDLHLMCGVLRAVECRKPMLIAANTGFSAWIDGSGRIVKQGPRRKTGVIVADVQRDPRRSVYLEMGELPAGVCLLGCVGLALLDIWDRRRAKRGRLQQT